MKVQMDVTAASQLIENGKMPELMETALGRIRPEAAYLAPKRKAYGLHLL